MNLADARSTAEFMMPDPRGLTAAARRTLTGVWTYRANAEREAVARFTRLTGELAEVGAPAEAILLGKRAIEDERRHTRLCVALASTYGGETPELRPIEELPLGPKHFGFRERVLYETVAFCCVTETLNSALMKVAHDSARVPEARAALRLILRDEVRHSRIGWAHLAAERAAGRGQWLPEMLPKMMAGAVREELFTPGPEPRDVQSLIEHGELPEVMRLEVFEASVRDVIEPGLRSMGVSTAPLISWVERMLAAGRIRARDMAEKVA